MIASLHSVAQTVDDVWAVVFPPVIVGYVVWLFWGMRRSRKAGS